MVGRSRSTIDGESLMLAGNIKRKNFFRGLSALGVAGATGVGLWAGIVGSPPASVEAPPASSARVSAPVEPRTASQDTTTNEVVKLQRAPLTSSRPMGRPAAREQDAVPVSAGSDMADSAGMIAPRAWDELVLSMQGSDLGTDKRKDVTKGRQYKVNLYQDAGEPVMNRAKVDIDRDDRWDEKWTFHGDEITLQRATSDDERYDATWRWTGSSWVVEP
jgi:hypothetical protein